MKKTMILPLFLLGIGLAGLQAQQRIKVKNLPFDTFEGGSDEEINFEEPTGADFGTGRVGETSEDASESSDDDGQDKEGEKSGGGGKCTGEECDECEEAEKVLCYLDIDLDGFHSEQLMKCPAEISKEASLIIESKGHDCNDGDGRVQILNTCKECVAENPLVNSRTSNLRVVNDCPFCEETKPYYIDNDNDGYGTFFAGYYCERGTSLTSNKPPKGFASNDLDCDDENPLLTRNTPNGNCQVCIETRSFWVDNDGDGYGAGTSIERCEGSIPPTGYVDNDFDCDDTNPTKFRTNSKGTCVTCSPTTNLYKDNDQDGYGVEPVFLTICDNNRPIPVGLVKNATDCNDFNPLKHSGSDCEECTEKITVYRDADGDKMGDASTARQVCKDEVPDGFVYNALDCDDTNSEPNPISCGCSTEDKKKIPLADLTPSDDLREFLRTYEDPRQVGKPIDEMFNDAPVRGNCTVGYGKLVHHGPCGTGSNQKKEQPYLNGITEQEAEQLLDEEIDIHFGELRDHLEKKGVTKLTQSELDALMELGYNGGVTSKLDKVIDTVKNGNQSEIEKAIKGFKNKIVGDERRQDAVDMYNDCLYKRTF